MDRYTPSAVVALHRASDIQAYDSYVTYLISKVSPETIRGITHEFTSVSGFTHHLFLVQPSPNSESTPIFTFPSAYIADKFLAGIRLKNRNAAREYFETSNQIDGTKTLASQLLGSVFRARLHEGGVWEMRRMEVQDHSGNSNRIWKIKPASSWEVYSLVVGHQARPSHYLCNTPPTNGFLPLETHWLHYGTSRLVEGYHIPTSQMEASLGSFYFEESVGIATLFQATVSPLQSVSEDFLARLERLGVTAVRYVAVTNQRDGFQLCIPKGREDFIKERFHIFIPTSMIE